MNFMIVLAINEVHDCIGYTLTS